ncbi:DUF2165 family protein [Sinorhizobium garamanticum]|uniref:DUF2165 family protein n=1 Tax=Sinorhizobium garamanticum TaxID=680247 RepID=UPI003144DE35
MCRTKKVLSMSPEATFWLFQLTAAACLALWMIVAVANNVQGFQASVGAVGVTMSMTLLKEAPLDKPPFHNRAVNSVAAHRVALIGVLVRWLVRLLFR